MPGINKNFPKVKPGDLISAKTHNELLSQVRALSQFPVGSGVLINGAGVFPKGERRVKPRRFYKITSEGGLHRTSELVTGKLLRWNSTDEEYEITGDQVSIYGDLFRGYALQDDIVEAVLLNGRVQAVGTGTLFLRGVLDSDLESEGESTVSVYEFTASTWTDTGYEIDVVESLGLSDTITAGTKVFCTWEERSQIWIPTAAPCD